MKRLPVIASVIGNVAISIFFSLFVIANIRAFTALGDYTYLLVALNEAFYVALYLTRKRPVATSTSAGDWGVAFAGTFIGTLLRPTSSGTFPFGSILVVFGTLLNIASVVSLNRSIGTVPALRTIRTRGLYRWVRHPMYASEIVVISGYVLVNLSLLNICILVANVVLLLLRIDREESFLLREPAYREYVAGTSWKLLPYIY